MPPQDAPYSVRIFKILNKTVVEPYRRNNGLEWYELPFTHKGDRFLIRHIVGQESKTIIKITQPFNPDNVEVIDNNYKDLGEKLRRKLIELKN